MGMMGPSPQDEIMLRGQLEYQMEKRPPHRQPGDWLILLFTVAGIAAGTIIGLRLGQPVFWIAGFIGGGIAGSLVGALVKNLIMRRPGPQ